MHKIRLALDWMPNINHIGFFIAQEKGFYDRQGLEVVLLDPASDNYAITPAKKVETGAAELALCPTESIISYRTKEHPFDLLAIATIFQEDLSAIATKAEAGIRAPKDLDGKRYASYKARYEDAIVQQMIKNDGGKGSITVGYPAKLGIWDALIRDSFDATWIFLNWEGVEADALGDTFNYFKMSDYQVPYGYSPVIAASQRKIEQQSEAYRRFLAGTKSGFLHASQYPSEAIEVFRPFVPEKDQKVDLTKALSVSHGSFGNDATWGRMDPKAVERFLSWIYEHQLESLQLGVDDLITNGLLDTLSAE